MPRVRGQMSRQTGSWLRLQVAPCVPCTSVGPGEVFLYSLRVKGHPALDWDPPKAEPVWVTPALTGALGELRCQHTA